MSGTADVARKRVAVLISGRGSNMAALIEAAKAPDYPAEIVLVVANKADAGGLAIARGAGIPAIAATAKDKPAMEAEINRALDAADIDIVALAGFMRILSAGFVQRWAGRLINIHPSLLPAFPGLDTHGRALAAGMSRHGCTVHYVTAGVDEGPVIAQAEVPVLPGDTPETLAARVLIEEHKLYPKALAMVAGGSS
ncbi:MAG TPA: phosphoribosylglycinamide formyltransferase [Bauldia sp.]|nr:phosphoribosylglycinamide formyltransferase [Bauldia sp.]